MTWFWAQRCWQNQKYLNVDSINNKLDWSITAEKFKTVKFLNISFIMWRRIQCNMYHCLAPVGSDLSPVWIKDTSLILWRLSEDHVAS